MKQGLTEIVCVLDRSGSMGSIIGDAIGGFNSFLEDQKKEDGDANITVALFDNHYELLHDNVDIQKVEEITRAQYSPRGTTALNDSIGRTIDSVGSRLADTDESERPEKVIVAVLTDGYENASREYSADRIKEMISHQEDKYNWQFIYLAANQDAFAVGQGLGFDMHNSVDFNATAKGAKMAFANVSSYSTCVRSMDVGTLSKGAVAQAYCKVDEDDI